MEYGKGMLTMWAEHYRRLCELKMGRKKMHGLRTLIAINDGRKTMNTGMTMEISANGRADKLTANNSANARAIMESEHMGFDADKSETCEVCGGLSFVVGRFTKFRLSRCKDCGVDAITPIRDGVVITAERKVLN
jgi:hypothetical protein